MRFDDHFLEELKSRLKPSEVIGKSVRLRRQGREYVGLSPFTKEKTPSFYVNDLKGQFFDFSSGKNGDIISFVQETERLSFNEAVEKLAGLAGMDLPAVTPQAMHDEQVHADRWRDQRDLAHQDDENAEPDRVNANGYHHRHRNGHCQHEHGHRIHEHAEDDVEHDQDQKQRELLQLETGLPLRHHLRGAEHRNSDVEQQGTTEHDDRHACGAGGLDRAVLAQRGNQPGPGPNDHR